MIPVDLNRLREAREFLADGEMVRELTRHDAELFVASIATLAATAVSVLDAPTVRWCETHESVVPFGDPNNCESWAQGAIGGCSISVRALVPVKGES